jgi:23S rRNA pseudoU1915 N3-methylase RlmH
MSSVKAEGVRGFTETVRIFKLYFKSFVKYIFFRYLDVQAQERRSRQQMETQLNQEKRLRKQAEEKAMMVRCPDSCKIKKMHLEGENNKLRRDLMLLDEAKNNAEKQNRMLEQEVTYFNKIYFL